MSTLLLSTLHDPEARLLSWARRLSDGRDPLGAAWSEIATPYAEAIVVASPPTAGATIHALEAAGFVAIRGSDAPDRGLWDTVRLGLERPVERLHFCDLDRFVHWLDRFPDELRALSTVWDQADLTMLVRTPRAFATHPACQTLTEGVGNRLIADRIGRRVADAFSGSYVWSRPAARAIVATPGPRDLRFYVEGVLAPFRADCTIGQFEVEGLEWETPDQYPDEIARLGFEEWLRQFESPAQWRRRVEMLNQWVESALTIG